MQPASSHMKIKAGQPVSICPCSAAGSPKEEHILSCAYHWQGQYATSLMPHKHEPSGSQRQAAEAALDDLPLLDCRVLQLLLLATREAPRQMQVAEPLRSMRACGHHRACRCQSAEGRQLALVGPQPLSCLRQDDLRWDVEPACHVQLAGACYSTSVLALQQ